MANASVMAYFTKDAQTRLVTDASPVGLSIKWLQICINVKQDAILGYNEDPETRQDATELEWGYIHFPRNEGGEFCKCDEYCQSS